MSFGGLHPGDVDVSEAEPATGTRTRRAAIGYDLNAFVANLLSPTSVRREIPWRCRQRCSEDRGSCGIVACKA